MDYGKMTETGLTYSEEVGDMVLAAGPETVSSSDPGGMAGLAIAAILGGTAYHTYQRAKEYRQDLEEQEIGDSMEE
jgi:hypothetical protein